MSWREDMDAAAWDAWDDEQSARADARLDGPLTGAPASECYDDSEDES